MLCHEQKPLIESLATMPVVAVECVYALVRALVVEVYQKKSSIFLSCFTRQLVVGWATPASSSPTTTSLEKTWHP